MEDKLSMRYVDTNTASVKMTSGVPVIGSPMSNSSLEDELENFNELLNKTSTTSNIHNKTYSLSAANIHRTHNSSEVPVVGRPLSNSSLEDELENHNEFLNKITTTTNIDSKTHNSSATNIHNTRLDTNITSKKGGVNEYLVESNIKQINPEHGLQKKQNLHSQHSDQNISHEEMQQGLNFRSSKLLNENNYVNNSVPNDLGFSNDRLDERTNIDNETRPNVLSSHSRGRESANPRSDKSSKVLKNQQYKPTTKIQNINKSHNTSGVVSVSAGSDKHPSENNQKFVAIRSSHSQQSSRLSQSLENSQEKVMKQWQEGMISSNSLSAITNNNHLKQKTRVNPFDNDILIDEDHFSVSCDNYFKTKKHSTESTKSSSISQDADWWQEQSDISFAELGLSEDHFSHPQGHFGLSRAEELELAIENCKELIREAVPNSDKQKNLVLKLVQLRIKLQEVKEGPEPVPDNVQVIMSHKMMQKNSRTSKYYCERCNGAIWGMLQVWYRCTECGYRCHEKCLQQILRTCAKAKVLENPTLISEICPKETNSLAGQNYRCWECRLAISFKSGHSEPRLCDYVGRYYCEFCHWNDTYVIPARVLHCWDFIPRKVSRSSKQFLKLMQKKAVIRIQDINPMLFVYVDQLNEIKKLREEMMIMKKYILSCPNAMLAKLLLLLENRQHFVECSDRYSMQDLLDAEDTLLPELVNVHSTWVQHIKVDCELCQGRGFFCELCGDKDVLFPFDSIAVVCAKCSAVLHRHCFAKSNLCPRCERRGKRESLK